MFTEAVITMTLCGTEGTVVAANVQIVREVPIPMFNRLFRDVGGGNGRSMDVVMANNGTDDDLIMGYNRLEMANDMLDKISILLHIPQNSDSGQMQIR